MVRVRSAAIPKVARNDLLSDVDGSLAIAGRYRDITSAIIAEQGGVDQCSESRKQLIRRFAAAAVLAEQMEGHLARGEAIDIKDHASLSATMLSIARHLGVDQVARTVTPTLAEYLKLKAQEKEPQ
jgi:hypothetical protein